jgi:hypothetical protein
MNAWTQLNEWKAALNEKNLSLEKKVQQVVPIDSRNPLKGSNGRYKRKASLFEQMAKAFADYVSKVKSIETANLDPEVALLTVAEADTAQRVSDACRHLSNISAAQSEDGLSEGEARLNRLKRDLANLRTARDVLRVKLNRRYDKSFPALEDGAGDARSSAINDEPAGDGEFSKGNAAGRDQGAVAPDRADNASPAAAKRSESRVWTDRSGQHQIQAKFLGIEDDKAKLEKPDGKVIFVPLDSLSEADQRFIGVAE